MVCDESLVVETASALGLPGHLVLLTLASLTFAKVGLDAIGNAVDLLIQFISLCLQPEVVVQILLKRTDADGGVDAVGIHGEQGVCRGRCTIRNGRGIAVHIHLEGSLPGCR